MLKKKFRGLSTTEVSDLFKGRASSVGSRFFRINWKATSQDFPEFVVITPRSLHKSAAHRNRFRRQVYSLIERVFSDWTRGVRVAILVKNGALTCSRREFEDHFLRLLQKTQLI